jgi:hypothetical protein
LNYQEAGKLSKKQNASSVPDFSVLNSFSRAQRTQDVRRLSFNKKTCDAAMFDRLNRVN